MPVWIRTPADLAARFAEPPPRIGLDSEFIRERTYWPQLALVQIAFGERDEDILLVDPLEPGMPEAIAAILTDARVLSRFGTGAPTARMISTTVCFGFAKSGTSSLTTGRRSP